MKIRDGDELARTSQQTTRAALASAIEALDLMPVAMPGGARAARFSVALGADTALPDVAAEADFAGGDDDSDGVTTTELREALDRVPDDLGPMQVAAPDRNTDEDNEELLDYAQDSDRVALLEQEDGLSVGTIAASAATLRALGSGAEGTPRLGAMWAQHFTGPGYTPGTTRTVPASVVVAGLLARLEREEGHPNVAPAGDMGVPRWATGVTRYFSDADRLTLFEAGVNIVTAYLNRPRNATFRSLEDGETSEWVDFAHSRLAAAMIANAKDVGRSMGHRIIDRAMLSEFGSLVRTRLAAYHGAGALLQDIDLDEALIVDTDTVNDAESMAAREVNLELGFVPANHAEVVNITMTKIPIGQAV